MITVWILYFYIAGSGISDPGIWVSQGSFNTETECARAMVEWHAEGKSAPTVCKSKKVKVPQ